MPVTILIDEDDWALPRLPFFPDHRLNEKHGMKSCTLMWPQNLWPTNVGVVAHQQHQRIGERVWDSSSENSIWSAGYVRDVALKDHLHGGITMRTPIHVEVAA